MKRRKMWEVGVEGDRFNLHDEMVSCKAVGCVPLNEPPALDSAFHCFWSQVAIAALLVYSAACCECVLFSAGFSRRVEIDEDGFYYLGEDMR